MSVIRAFIAVELSTGVQLSLQDVCSHLGSQLKQLPVRLVPVKNIHLTLIFLGDVSVNNLEALKNMLTAEAANYHPFEIGVGQMGVFPSFRKPRVIWIGVQAPSELFSLQHRVEAETTRLGYPPEDRGFTPHLTVGRVSRNASPGEVREIGEILETQKIEALGIMKVESVNLYRSDLQPSGALYTRIISAGLNA